MSDLLTRECGVIPAVAAEIGLRLLVGQMAFQPALFVLLVAPEFFQPLRQLGAKYHAGMNGSVALRRIHEILDTPLPEQRSGTTIPPEGGNSDSTIALHASESIQTPTESWYPSGRPVTGFRIRRDGMTCSQGSLQANQPA